MRWVELRWSEHAIRRVEQRCNGMTVADVEALIQRGDYANRRWRKRIKALCPVATSTGANRNRCFIVLPECNFVAVLEAHAVGKYAVVTVFFVKDETQ